MFSFKSLKTKIFISVFIPFLVFLIAICMYLTVKDREVNRQNFQIGSSMFASLVNDSINIIDSWLQDRMKVVDTLAQQDPDPRSCLHLVPTTDAADFYRDDSGEYWRVYDVEEDRICLQAPESPEDFYQSAVAFGHFQNLTLVGVTLYVEGTDSGVGLHQLILSLHHLLRLHQIILLDDRSGELDG